MLTSNILAGWGNAQTLTYRSRQSRWGMDLISPPGIGVSLPTLIIYIESGIKSFCIYSMEASSLFCPASYFNHTQKNMFGGLCKTTLVSLCHCHTRHFSFQGLNLVLTIDAHSSL